ncbi:MAG: hypothetical protein WBX02_11355 [Terriglobales bacterium]
MAHMYLLTATLVIAGGVVLSIALRRGLARRCEELRLEFRRQIDSLSANVTALERTIATRNAPAKGESTVTRAGATSEAVAQGPLMQVSDEITPETLAAITKTITALLGRKIHVRSVRLLATPDAASNPWAQNGRAVIQASHNFSQRKRES